ncbi:MAG: hypothetical protein JW784_02040, partial [Candidatus Cloacimonetes bacterium]|nr:hypothetical protein [Candidatus Cloacimonadota bacterium]
MKFTSLFLLVILLLISCSSLPRYVTGETRQQADRNFQLGQKAENSCDYTRAHSYYARAYHDYTSIDHLQGKVQAGLSLARQYYLLGDSLNHQQWLDYLDLLISSEMQQMQPALDLHLIEIAYLEKDFRKAISLASRWQSINMEWEAQRLSYLLLSQAAKGDFSSQEFAELKKLLPGLYKNFRKGRMLDPGVYSYALYTSGYLLTCRSEWEPAEAFFRQAYETDLKLENTSGLASDLFALG